MSDAVHTPEPHLIEFKGKLIAAADDRTRLLDNELHNVPVICMRIALDAGMRNELYIEQPFPADHHKEAHAAARRLKAGMHVAVQVPIFDLRLSCRNAVHIHVIPDQPEEQPAP